MFNLRGKDEFDRFFGNLFSNGNNRFRVDIDELENEIHVEAELPGVTKSDINVEYKTDILSIYVSEGSSISKDRLERYMMRSFTIPNIDFDKAKATYREGLLSIILPKKEMPDKKALIPID